VTRKFYSTRYRGEVSGYRPASLLVWISYVHCQISGSRTRCWWLQCSWRALCEMEHIITQCHLSGNYDLNQYSLKNAPFPRQVRCWYKRVKWIVQSHTTVVSCCNLNEARVPAVADLDAQLRMNRSVVIFPLPLPSFIHPAGRSLRHKRTHF
jgi:hypothetical protein